MTSVDPRRCSANGCVVSAGNTVDQVARTQTYAVNWDCHWKFHRPTDPPAVPPAVPTTHPPTV